MNRRMDREFKVFWRRLSPRYFKMVITLISAVALFGTIVYLSIQYVFYPIKATFITETTTKQTTTTRTTTTMPVTTQKSFDIGCFFAKTNITLSDGSIRSLDRLTTGDEVLVYSSSLGKIEKSRVLAIFHHQRSSVRFLDIYTTDNQEPLRLTPTHSILTKKNSAKQSSFHYDFAYNIAINDWIVSSKLESIQVMKIEEILLYNQTISTPLTFEGSIIVNNLLASCYATFNHQLMHFLTTPIRYWYQIERFSRFNSFLIHFIDFYSKINF